MPAAAWTHWHLAAIPSPLPAQAQLFHTRTHLKISASNRSRPECFEGNTRLQRQKASNYQDIAWCGKAL